MIGTQQLLRHLLEDRVRYCLHQRRLQRVGTRAYRRSEGHGRATIARGRTVVVEDRLDLVKQGGRKAAVEDNRALFHELALLRRREDHRPSRAIRRELNTEFDQIHAIRACPGPINTGFLAD
jgi:hypothetical protein